MVVNFVVSVISLKLYNIFSSIVIMLIFSGMRFIGCLVLPRQQACPTCLEVGQNGAAQAQLACIYRSIRLMLGNLARKK